MPFNEYNIKFLALYEIRLRDTDINSDNLMSMLELNALDKAEKRMREGSYDKR